MKQLHMTINSVGAFSLKFSTVSHGETKPTSTEKLRVDSFTQYGHGSKLRDKFKFKYVNKY